MERQNEQVECCVCMTESETEPKELSETIPDDSPETLLWSACNTHCICKACLIRLATSFGQSHPIGPQHPMIRCPYPFETCLNVFTDAPNYFSHAIVERLLSDEDRERYVAHANRFQFPGFELISCPRPIVSGSKCGAGILISIEDIQTLQPGHLIMHCDQTAQCQRQSCYHCHSLIPRNINQCDVCLTATENANPAALNHYFYKPGKRLGDNKPPLFQNNELTAEIATQQILEIINSDRLEIRCIECLTILQKTEQCNTLEHCGIERCYSCGRSGTRHHKLGDHWDSTGASGCPRFDHAIYWNVVADCRFRCNEGTCYNDEIGDCAINEHSSGIRGMIQARRYAHVYHALKSLLTDIRIETTKRLSAIPEARKWLPRFYSSDYRTYQPEPVMRMLGKARNIVNSIDPNNVSNDDAPTFEFARDFVNKASNLTFQEVAMISIIKRKPKHQVIFENFKTKYPAKTAKLTKKRAKVHS